MVFYNLFTFMSDQKAVNDVRALVIKLLEDEQLEVKSQVCGNTWLKCVISLANHSSKVVLRRTNNMAV